MEKLLERRSGYIVIASEAKQSREQLDCFVAALLAMTGNAYSAA